MIETFAESGVQHLVFRRESKKNALLPKMYADLTDALESADRSDEIRACLVVGSDTCFTAGNDLADFLGNPPTGADSPVFGFLKALTSARKPIVAGVAGPAVGIGTTMLLHMDLVYAAQSARFQLPFVPLGLCPEAASSYLLPRLCGRARASDVLLTGRPFGATEAMELGLLTAIEPDGAAALSSAEAAAHRLARLPPAAVRATKRLIREGLEPRVSEVMKTELTTFSARLRSDEAREAFSAFLEKRDPDFSPFR